MVAKMRRDREEREAEVCVVSLCVYVSVCVGYVCVSSVCASGVCLFVGCVCVASLYVCVCVVLGFLHKPNARCRSVATRSACARRPAARWCVSSRHTYTTHTTHNDTPSPLTFYTRKRSVAKRSASRRSA